MSQFTNKALLYASGPLSALAPALLIASYLAALKLKPFMFYGFASLVSIYLPERYQKFSILMIYLPALYSLYLLLSSGRPDSLVELAAGYILAIPIISTISYFKAQSIPSIYSRYFGAYVTSLFVLDAASNSKGNATLLFYSMIAKIPYLGSRFNVFSEQIQISPLFAPLTAISLIAFIVYSTHKLGSLVNNLYEKSIMLSVMIGLVAVGFIVLYSYAFQDAVILGMIYTSLSLAILSAYTRFAK